MVRRWGLTGWTGAALLVVAVALLIDPALRNDIAVEGAFLLLVSWAPMLIGGILAWALVKAFGDRDALDRRTAAAMESHPINRELVWLALFAVGFVVCMVVLSTILNMYGTQTGTDLAMSASLVSRLLFLFTLPLLVMDRSGVVIDGKGTAMPAIALKVDTPWRWLGMIPVAVVLGLIGFTLVPYVGLPVLSFPLIGFVLAFAVISVCEEIFFRGMLQTRLEMLMGRWGGIVATSVLFALVYAIVQPYDAVAQLPGNGLVYDMGLSLLTYATAGLLYGYLWTCFRNTWLNVILRIGVFLVLMPPDLQTGIV
ncbi:CPBP family intramembrane metalloprotease [Nocardiopsis sp. N85]|uniref:CPBP family intramembrane glutamic endopeptidase n=1 Tax=Nocardiopsis sp. N85 TaxID=3029400 RepID=UPI00237F2923|nr:CPBP family intramembrane glutamic endopeptidase [Nocardiopsis sp. N85]MDE3724423.1 CPBP family intramembrane metalloprotease [Nocardiopsis sp. N85]